MESRYLHEKFEFCTHLKDSWKGCRKNKCISIVKLITPGVGSEC